MVLLGTKSLGLYPLGGTIVQIGVGAPPYTPDLTFATAAEFKSTWGTMDTNYVVYDYINDGTDYEPFASDATFYIDIVIRAPIGGATTDGFAFTNYTYSYSY